MELCSRQVRWCSPPVPKAPWRRTRFSSRRVPSKQSIFTSFRWNGGRSRASDPRSGQRLLIFAIKREHIGVNRPSTPCCRTRTITVRRPLWELSLHVRGTAFYADPHHSAPRVNEAPARAQHDGHVTRCHADDKTPLGYTGIDDTGDGPDRVDAIDGEELSSPMPYVDERGRAVPHGLHFAECELGDHQRLVCW